MSSPLSITRSPKRKRTVALQVQPDGSVAVFAPVRTSLKWIEAFVASRAQWIQKRQKEVQAKWAARQIRLTPDTHVPYLGESAPLSHYCPAAVSMTDPAEMRTELILWYKKQARRELPARTALWAEKTGLRPSKVIVSAPRQRWGSCNEKNEIRLSWKLIMAPPDLIDYVIVHELSHIPHKNHGPRFWQCVANFMPDWQQKRRALRSSEKDPIHHTLA